jgi:hypothetical protein
MHELLEKLCMIFRDTLMHLKSKIAFMDLIACIFSLKLLL